MINNILWPFRKLKYRFKIYKKLSQYLFASWDIIEGIEKSLEILFIDFYENSGWKEHIDWESDDGHTQAKKDIEAIYRWLKWDKPAIETEVDVLTGMYFDLNPTRWIPYNNGNEYVELKNIHANKICEAYWEISIEKERAANIKHEEMLKKIIDVKRYLWL